MNPIHKTQPTRYGEVRRNHAFVSQPTRPAIYHQSVHGSIHGSVYGPISRVDSVHYITPTPLSHLDMGYLEPTPINPRLRIPAHHPESGPIPPPKVSASMPSKVSACMPSARHPGLITVPKSAPESANPRPAQVNKGPSIAEQRPKHTIPRKPVPNRGPSPALQKVVHAIPRKPVNPKPEHVKAWAQQGRQKGNPNKPLPAMPPPPPRSLRQKARGGEAKGGRGGRQKKGGCVIM